MQIRKWKHQDRVKHIDGRIGTVLNVTFDADGSCYLRVAYDDGGSDSLECGFFEKLPEAFQA